MLAYSLGSPATAGIPRLSAAVLIDLRKCEVSAGEPIATGALLVDDEPERVEAIARDPIEAKGPRHGRRALRCSHRRDELTAEHDRHDAVSEERRRFKARHADGNIDEASRSELAFGVARVEREECVVPGFVEGRDREPLAWRSAVRVRLTGHIALALEEVADRERRFSLECERRPSWLLAIDPTAHHRVVPVDDLVEPLPLIDVPTLLHVLDGTRRSVSGGDAIGVGESSVDVRDAAPRLRVHVLDRQLPDLEGAFRCRSSWRPVPRRERLTDELRVWTRRMHRVEGRAVLLVRIASILVQRLQIGRHPAAERVLGVGAVTSDDLDERGRGSERE